MPIAIFAHRGLSIEYPENTMSAFKAAEQAGADGIELDVQLSKDGVPVIIHDESLERTTNGAGFVRLYGAAIENFKCGTMVRPAFSNRHDPFAAGSARLDEADNPSIKY
ncbi:glycerophosphodiester phosphodiesterase family protein [Terrilactibacillus sp. S3-3]|nr:glycerophosphodiester phosphodiesterase family protein [Terrilactibacillus sp. S3-3]